MSRRNSGAAEAAAAAASEAARVLQQRGQEAKAERAEPKSEPEPKQSRDQSQPDPDRIERLRKARPHVQGMDEIVARDLKRRGIEDEARADKPKEEPKEEPAPKAAEEAPKPPVDEPAAVTVAEAPAEPTAPKTVRVKVDGEEFEAPEEEVKEAGGVAAYQREKATEKRLKAANETVAESKRLTAQLVELLNQRKEPEKPQVTDEEFIKSKMDVIRFGTPDESAGALREILQRSAPKPVDQNAIIHQALAAVDRRQAVADFGKEFPEVVSNPLLVKLAVSLETEEIANAQRIGHQVDWRKLYSTIGTKIRGVVPRGHHQSATTTQQAPSTTSSASEKEARKSSIVNLPPASARAEVPKEEKQLSPEEARKEAILEMKKSRGIPTG